MTAIKKTLDRLLAKRDVLVEQLRIKEQKLSECEQEKIAAEDARSILQLAAKRTQTNLETHFSNIVSKTLQLIFGNNYEFIPEFVERRNKTECDFWFKKNGKLLRPNFSSGGGVKDIASFALRLAYWKRERTAPVMLLDEPFKGVSPMFQSGTVEMLKLLSRDKELRTQMIIITHMPVIANSADRVLEIENGTLKCVENR